MDGTLLIYQIFSDFKRFRYNGVVRIWNILPEVRDVKHIMYVFKFYWQIQAISYGIQLFNDLYILDSI